MAYPKTLYKVVNSLDEEKEALDYGCTVEADGVAKQEFPKMLYLHPEDKTKEHIFVVVRSEDEANEAKDKGYQEQPHIPEVKDDKDYEKKPVDNPEIVAHKQDSPAEVIQHETGVAPENQHLDEGYQTDGQTSDVQNENQ